MPRFLRYLLLHLLVLTGLLWLGWRYARLSDREVLVLAQADEALEKENRRLQFENRALLIDMERKAMDTKLAADMRRLERGNEVHRAATEVVEEFQQIEKELRGEIGIAQEQSDLPRGELAVIWKLALDRHLNQRFDSLERGITALQSFAEYYKTSTDLQVFNSRLGFPKSRWQRVRQLGGVPLSAIQSELTRCRNIAVAIEGKVLNEIAGQITKELTCCFGNVTWIHGFPRTVLSGQLCEAECCFLYPCWGWKIITRPVFYQCKTIMGRSKLEIATAMPGQGYDIWGRRQLFWTATQQANVDYHDTTFTYAADYIVTRPRLEVTFNHQSPQLYRHCRNRLHLYHQMPPPEGTPTAKLVRVTGGHLLPGATLPELDIVADQPQVQITVLDPFDGSVVRTETFTTEFSPAPTLQLWSADSAVALRRGVAAGTRVLRIRATAEAWFAVDYPHDAQYRAQALVTLYRRGRMVGRPEKISSEHSILRQLPALALSGDWYAVEVTGVTRIDGEGKARLTYWHANQPWIVPLY